jgi:hypothetical protein
MDEDDATAPDAGSLFDGEAWFDLIEAVLPAVETTAMLFWAQLASGQIVMRKVNGSQSLAERPSEQLVGLAA